MWFGRVIVFTLRTFFQTSGVHRTASDEKLDFGPFSQSDTGLELDGGPRNLTDHRKK